MEEIGQFDLSKDRESEEDLIQMERAPTMEESTDRFFSKKSRQPDGLSSVRQSENSPMRIKSRGSLADSHSSYRNQLPKKRKGKHGHSRSSIPNTLTTAKSIAMAKMKLSKLNENLVHRRTPSYSGFNAKPAPTSKEDHRVIITTEPDEDEEELGWQRVDNENVVIERNYQGDRITQPMPSPIQPFLLHQK